jgi:hypothetical protein
LRVFPSARVVGGIGDAAAQQTTATACADDVAPDRRPFMVNEIGPTMSPCFDANDHDYRYRRILLKLYAIALQIHREIANDLFTETAVRGLS